MSEANRPAFSPLVEHAIELAAQWHEGTYRKNRWREAAFELPPEEILRVPVMAHVTAVAMTLQRAGWDDETVAAGFLHDVIEDANRFGGLFGYEELRRTAGEAVADRVRGVTEEKTDAEGRRLDWRTRKERYLAALRDGPEESVAISLADKLHNVWTMNEALSAGHDIFAREPGRQHFSAGPEEQLWFFTAVLDASTPFSDPRLHGLRSELAGQIRRFRALVRRENEFEAR